jgi:hypothetical protein
VRKNPELLDLDFDQEITKVLERERKRESSESNITVSLVWKVRRIFDKWKGINEEIPDFTERFRDIRDQES